MDQVTNFLNVSLLTFTILLYFVVLLLTSLYFQETREDLRCSMAKDAAAIKNESLLVDNDGKGKETSENLTEGQTVVLPVQDISLDFQRKITVSKHEMQSFSSAVLLENEGPLNSLLGN